ncbi:hypothetical protein GS506_29215 [Rhodococcus hoagii]|nr:hypothetical protein [Prescottella equi]
MSTRTRRIRTFQSFGRGSRHPPGPNITDGYNQFVSARTGRSPRFPRAAAANARDERRTAGRHWSARDPRAPPKTTPPPARVRHDHAATARTELAHQRSHTMRSGRRERRV